jgi:hypothetical protein
MTARRRNAMPAVTSDGTEVYELGTKGRRFGTWVA